MKKAELEESLDNHLVANKTTYSDKSELSDFYKRLARSSPTKRRQTMTKVKREEPERYSACPGIASGALKTKLIVAFRKQRI